MAHEVISAFLDNEPFDAQELGNALADPSGRELFLDMIALRAIVTEEHTAVDGTINARALSRQRRRGMLVGFAAAAAVFAAIGALMMPSRRAPQPAASVSTSAETDPPTPDHVVTFESGRDWHRDQ